MFNPREHSQPIAFRASLFFACLLLSAIASAAPSITLSRKTGPPTSRILVSGRGFKPNVGVDIYFDTKDEALVVTNGRGEFDKAGIHTPRSARPGKHWVTALERDSDKGAQDPFLVLTNWSQYRFNDNHLGINSYENVLNKHNVSELNLHWSYSGLEFFSSPAVVAGIVYGCSDDGNVYALDAESGSLVWKYSTGAGIFSSPDVANGDVYVGSIDKHIYALDAVTGTRVWDYATGGEIDSSPAVANGIVYVGSSDGEVYAFNANNGKLLWHYKTRGGVQSSPAIEDGVVYIGSDDQNIYALNARSGDYLWSYQTAGAIHSSPVIASNGTVFVSSDKLYAISSGSLLWSYTTGGADFSSPALMRNVIYGGSQTKIYALNATTGTLLWASPIPSSQSSPAVANGVAYIGSDEDTLYALDSDTGAMLWTYPSVAPFQSSPAVVNGMVFIGSIGDSLLAFGLGSNAEDRSRLFNRPDPKRLHPDLNLKASKPGAAGSDAKL
jgi:outer membrane protein assembly factor BamB